LTPELIIKRIDYWNKFLPQLLPVVNEAVLHG